MVDKGVLLRQSQVQKTGDDWEAEVMRLLLPKIEKYDLNIVKGKTKEVKQMFWNQLSVPTKRKGVWGDIDLIAYNKSSLKVISVISCKVSLHGRFSESLFYSLLFKDKLKRPFKFVFVTNDKGRQQKEGKWQSEWGTNDKPTKDRDLAETYTDGVYVKNSETCLGGICKDIIDLANDLIEWNKELN